MKKKFNLDAKLIQEKVNNRENFVEIAKYYGCSHSLLGKFCRKNNIKPFTHNLLNYEFGKFKVIKKLDSRGKSGRQEQYWQCQCVCGNFREMPTKSIHCKKPQISCGCYYKTLEYKKKLKNWNGVGEFSSKFYGRMIRGAKKRGWKMLVSMEFLWHLYEKQNRKCALTGIPIVFDTTSRQLDGNASLDRIDSSKDYTEDNVQWVCKQINWMKQDYDNEEYKYFCTKVHNYSNNNEKLDYCI